MTLKLLARRLTERGGPCQIWLAYEEDRADTVSGADFRLKLVRAFWERHDAFAWAAEEHHRRPSLHYHVYRVVADAAWVEENTLRRVQHAASFQDAGERPQMSVAPGAVALALGEMRKV